MAKSKTRISKLRVNEVSLVDRPANPAAVLVIAKRDEPVEIDDLNEIAVEDVEKKMCSECGERKAMPGSDLCADCAKMAKAWDYGALLDMSLESIFDDDSLSPVEKQAKIDETISQYRDGVLALEKQSPDAEGDEPQTGNHTMPDNITKSEVEQLLKGLSPEQAKAVEDILAKSMKPAMEAIEKAQKEAKEAKDEIAKRDRLAKAEKLVKNTAVKPEDLAKVLETTGDNKDVEAFIADTLSKLDTAIKAGRVLNELGSDNGSDTTAPDAELQKAVAEIQKSDSKLTKEQAFAKALALNPQLYDQYLATKK